MYLAALLLSSSVVSLSCTVGNVIEHWLQYPFCEQITLNWNYKRRKKNFGTFMGIHEQTSRNNLNLYL